MCEDICRELDVLERELEIGAHWRNRSSKDPKDPRNQPSMWYVQSVLGKYKWKATHSLLRIWQTQRRSTNTNAKVPCNSPIYLDEHRLTNWSLHNLFKQSISLLAWRNRIWDEQNWRILYENIGHGYTRHTKFQIFRGGVTYAHVDANIWHKLLYGWHHCTTVCRLL